jgi:hypothetical protein
MNDSRLQHLCCPVSTPQDAGYTTRTSIPPDIEYACHLTAPVSADLWPFGGQMYVRYMFLNVLVLG